MCLLVVLDPEAELPELQCSGCDMIFSVVWNRNPVFTKIEYCPFCGEEVEDIIPETTSDED